MRRTVLILLALCALMRVACAETNTFCDAIPKDVLALEMESNPGSVYLDCIMFPSSPQGESCYLLTEWGLQGYIRQDGAWQRITQVSGLMPRGASSLRFVRHEDGFDIVDLTSINAISFRWQGSYLSLTGWQSAAARMRVALEDGVWVYSDVITGERQGSVRIEALTADGLGVDFEQLPHTLEAARRMEAISEENVKGAFPGWTMGYYESYNSHRNVLAIYYQVDGTMLALRTASMDSDVGGVTRQVDSMPVPLSPECVSRLETDLAQDLCEVVYSGSTFLNSTTLDMARLHVTGEVLQSDMQQHGLLLLLQDNDGNRRICWVERQKGEYVTRETKALPKDIYLDLFHSGDNEISLEWDGQKMQCCFQRTADGHWSLDWVMASEEQGTEDFSFTYCGMMATSAGMDSSDILVGSHPWHDLFSIDLSTLPKSVREAADSLDREGWAVVCNPDPNDRLHLREKPDRASASLGKFYNHTPLRVLEQKGDWTRVTIGLDGRLEGWMLTKYLAFGSAMDTVRFASPYKVLREEYLDRNELFASDKIGKTTGVSYGGFMWIAGVIENEWYILLDENGNTGYLPQSWLYDGNG